jgi:hypothetical protein
MERITNGDTVKLIERVTIYGKTIPAGTQGTILKTYRNNGTLKYSVDFDNYGEAVIYSSEIELSYKRLDHLK